MATFLGELAALGTSVCWTGSSTFFASGSRLVGSVTVNRWRLLVAAGLLTLTHWLLLGHPLPLTAEPRRWMWLSLSGVVGLAIGDAFLFQAYVWIGPRLSMLVMTTAPVMGALLAWAALGERMRPGQWAGVILTILGIAWVVLDKANSGEAENERRDYRRGLIFGLGAALGQAGGLVLSKNGLYGDFSALSANTIRILAASAAMWLLTLLQGQAGATLRRLSEQPRALLPILGGSFFGPYLGVWLSLVSIQHTTIGVASTLMALPPIFLLPVGRYVFKERVGWRAAAGTLVALAGVALLFLT
jgi:drug/metabolite transporter (DMT)-like permease